MSFLQQIVAPIIIGAVIGYFTNYLAIKMLFRPRKPWKIGSWALPFTPGIIPKNRDRIAKAVANAVSESLVTHDDIKQMLMGSRVKEAFVNEVVEDLTATESTMNQLVTRAVGEENFEVVKDAFADYVYQRVSNGFSSLDLESIISDGGAAFMKEKATGMMSLLLNESMIKSLSVPIANGIRDYFKEKAEELLKPVVVKEIDELGKQTAGAIVEQFGIDEEFMRGIIENIYTKAVDGKGDEIIAKFDIGAIVESRVSKMDMDELEALIMSVMERELKAVIRLGALLGAVIGCLNVLIYRL